MSSTARTDPPPFRPVPLVQQVRGQTPKVAKQDKKKQPKATAAETQAFVDTHLADWKKWRVSQAMDPNQPVPDVPMMEPK
mgnify:CR=1 FL=1